MVDEASAVAATVEQAISNAQETAEVVTEHAAEVIDAALEHAADRVEVAQEAAEAIADAALMTALGQRQATLETELSECRSKMNGLQEQIQSGLATLRAELVQVAARLPMTVLASPQDNVSQSIPPILEEARTVAAQLNPQDVVIVDDQKEVETQTRRAKRTWM